jgi:acetate kinase
MPKPVLVLNAGSSSIKFGLFDTADALTKHLFAGEVADIGDKPHLTIKDMDGKINLLVRKDAGCATAFLSSLSRPVSPLKPTD